MNWDSFVLVLLSAAGHAWWNLLLKRSGGSTEVVGLSKVFEAALFLPLVLVSGDLRRGDLWLWPAVGAALVLANYLFLSAAYRRGDLSLAYPIARGGMLAMLPPLAFVTIGERLSATGLTAIGITTAGIFVLRGRGSAPGGMVVFALLAAFTGACYTVWDKQAIQILSPVTYFASYSVLVGIAYGVLLFRGGGWRAAWTQERRVIVRVGLLNSASYLLALAALRSSPASYVISARQLSIAFGAALGWRLLGESMPSHRRLGIALVVIGCVLIAAIR